MHHHSNAGEVLGGFPIWIIVIGFIVLVVLIGIYFYRKRMQSDYLTSEERKSVHGINERIKQDELVNMAAFYQRLMRVWGEAEF